MSSSAESTGLPSPPVVAVESGRIAARPAWIDSAVPAPRRIAASVGRSVSSPLRSSNGCASSTRSRRWASAAPNSGSHAFSPAAADSPNAAARLARSTAHSVGSCPMGVAPPQPVPEGLVARVRSDMRWQRAARGQFPPGELGFSTARTRQFERDPLPLLLRLYEEYGPVHSIRLLYAPIVFAIGPEANHYITVSGASNFRWRDGGMGDLIPLLGDGLLTTDGDYHRRARRIM